MDRGRTRGWRSSRAWLPIAIRATARTTATTSVDDEQARPRRGGRRTGRLRTSVASDGAGGPQASGPRDRRRSPPHRRRGAAALPSGTRPSEPRFEFCADVGRTTDAPPPGRRARRGARVLGAVEVDDEARLAARAPDADAHVLEDRVLEVAPVAAVARLLGLEREVAQQDRPPRRVVAAAADVLAPRAPVVARGPQPRTGVAVGARAVRGEVLRPAACDGRQAGRPLERRDVLRVGPAAVALARPVRADPAAGARAVDQLRARTSRCCTRAARRPSWARARRPTRRTRGSRRTWPWRGRPRSVTGSRAVGRRSSSFALGAR